MGHYIVGITGATGTIFGVRLIRELLCRGYQTTVLITDAGKTVFNRELGLSFPGDGEETESKLKAFFGPPGEELLTYYPVNKIDAPVASGSFFVNGMAVVPCSMSTLSGIACGRSSNLLERAADVCMKEGRTLLLSPRETPLSAIHLENMASLARLGVAIVPPMPAFYHAPKSLDDVINFVTGKILDRLGLEHTLFEGWKG